MIELQRVTIRAGQFVLRELSVCIEAGQYAMLMGQTGQGKTTILEAICGLRSVSCGRILIRGTDVTSWSPADRQVGYVPQDLALFPTLTVRQHLQFALKLRRWKRSHIEARTRELAALLGIESLLSRSVAELSGGEAQRVALGRALSFRPAVLLLDEPLSALDSTTRQEMHVLLSNVKACEATTVLHVTHNAEDAAALADVVLTLQNGKLSDVADHGNSANSSTRRSAK